MLAFTAAGLAIQACAFSHALRDDSPTASSQGAASALAAVDASMRVAAAVVVVYDGDPVVPAFSGQSLGRELV
jgi:hypothetical protein